VHYWYYAGETTGSELVYPKSQAMEIARASGESVMSTDTESRESSALRNSKITSVSPSDANAQPTQTDTTTAPQQPAPQPSTTPVTTAPTTTAPDTTQQNPTQPQTIGTSGKPESLPHTASNAPLIGLIGLTAIAAAFALRAARRMIA
jgi:hypothetical protein